MRLVATERPKWFEFRRWIARILVKLAQKIYPDSPDILAFHAQQIYDLAVHGLCVTRIDPLKYKAETEKK